MSILQSLSFSRRPQQPSLKTEQDSCQLDRRACKTPRSITAWALITALVLTLASLGCSKKSGGAADDSADASATVRVAVAANFLGAANQLSADYENTSKSHVELAPGSTGKLFAQIVEGAPFDVFLSADSARPLRLEEMGLVASAPRVTYALGKLVLWCLPDDEADSSSHCEFSTDNPIGGDAWKRDLGAFIAGAKRIAIADPAVAPYGAAAKETLLALGVWRQVEARLVRGESIAQTYQFVATGNASMGLIARSQVATLDGAIEIPTILHAPLEQQAVQLRATESARAFMTYLQSPAARSRIRAAGYDLPAPNAKTSALAKKSVP